MSNNPIKSSGAADQLLHDPSEGYLAVLTQVLAHFGVNDGPLDI